MSTLREQFDAYNERPRRWLDSDGKEDWAFNFYDWFCKDTALENRAKKLMPTAKRFAHIQAGKGRTTKHRCASMSEEVTQMTAVGLQLIEFV